MNNELLARIEKLEQAIQDIWASCSCLRKELEPDEWEMPNCEPSTCEDCGEYHCVCEPESEDVDEGVRR